MKKQYFGTDGIRGEVGQFPIVPEFMTRLGYAAGKVLSKNAKAGERCKVLIGKDTRISGYLLESALQAGFAAAGVDVKGQRARRIAGLGDERAARGQTRDQKGIDGPDHGLALAQLGGDLRPVFQQPGDLGAAKIRIQNQAGALPDQLFVSLSAEARNDVSTAFALPNNTAVQGPVGASFKHAKGLALIGQA